MGHGRVGRQTADWLTEPHRPLPEAPTAQRKGVHLTLHHWMAPMRLLVLLAGGLAATADEGSSDASRPEGSIPTPSAAQHRYQSTDFVALIHFNMGTFAIDSDPACPSTLAA